MRCVHRRKFCIGICLVLLRPQTYPVWLTIQCVTAIDNERIQKSISKLRKFARKVPKKSPPEEIHQLRTNARKLEAVFEALSPDSKKSERQLIKDIRKIHKRAGKVRDLDVLTGHLAGVHVDDVHRDGEEECQVELLEHLGVEPRKQAGKLRTWIRKHRAELKRGLEKAGVRIEKSLANQQERSSLAAARALQLSSELDIPKHFNRGNLHPYRLKIKQLRYVLQLALSQNVKFVDDLGKAKDAIGEWHDWEELVEIAENVLDHRSGCNLIKKLKEITTSKFEEAVRVAERLRKQYLKAPSHNTRKTSRSTVKLTPTAISATAVLAETAERRAA